jgi:DNA-binding transcriptional LysR family regulator
MRLEWIEDILAVADTGSMIKAAQRRFLTQSAFSRRLRMIEDQLGVKLFDRSRKPAELHPAILERCDDMRRLAAGLRGLRADLSRGYDKDGGRIVIASQHAITTAIAPRLIQILSEELGTDIRLRSANREDCYALLLTRQADLMLFYSTQQHSLTVEPDFIRHFPMGQELLVPIFARQALDALGAAMEGGEVPVVAYPADVFLGKVIREEIWSRFPELTFKPRAETALTLAAMEFAILGAAVAWVPRSLAYPHIASGVVEDLSAKLGTSEMLLTAARINAKQRPLTEHAWQSLTTDGPIALRTVLNTTATGSVAKGSVAG